LMVVARVCWRLSIVNLGCNCGTRGILHEILAEVWRRVFSRFLKRRLGVWVFFVCCGGFLWCGLFSGGMDFFAEVCVERGVRMWEMVWVHFLGAKLAAVRQVRWFLQLSGSIRLRLMRLLG
jgi:hypothetical protein